MSNSAKSRFAGFLRGLLHRKDDPGETLPVSAPRPVATAATAPVVAPVEYAPAPAPAMPAVDEISLPLAPVIASLPMELRGKIMSVPSPGMTFKLPVETITSQLAFGAVKITFGELRQLAPGIFSNSGGDLDCRPINLPLHEILPRLSPSMLSRRTAPKVEVSEEIAGPFGSRCAGVSFSKDPLKAKPAPAPKPVVTPAPVRVNTPVPPPAAFTPTTAPRVNLPAPSAPPKPTPIAFTPPPAFEFPTKPAKPANGNGNGHAAPPTPPPAAPSGIKFSAAPAPVPTPAPAPKPVAPRPEPAQPKILASLWDLAENWPGELKQEILAHSLSNENVTLAGALVEAGLKRGRIKMTWRELRTLAKPSSTPSPNDELELELPLKVIAPLFFAAQKNLQGAKKKAGVSDDIPNLFFGFPQAAPTPAPIAAARPVEIAPEKKSNDSNIYIWGDDGELPEREENLYAPPPVPQTDFTSRHLQPKDVVARAMALPGVAGVVIALPDGLRVASQVPADLNADTLAAFIPQMFERMNQSARELRMGALNNVSFTVGNVPWKIFRVNAVYVAAFGRLGESLPSADIAALANELDRKK